MPLAPPPPPPPPRSPTAAASRPPRRHRNFRAAWWTPTRHALVHARSLRLDDGSAAPNRLMRRRQALSTHPASCGRPKRGWGCPAAPSWSCRSRTRESDDFAAHNFSFRWRCPDFDCQIGRRGGGTTPCLLHSIAHQRSQVAILSRPPELLAAIGSLLLSYGRWPRGVQLLLVPIVLLQKIDRLLLSSLFYNIFVPGDDHAPMSITRQCRTRTRFPRPLSRVPRHRQAAF